MEGSAIFSSDARDQLTYPADPEPSAAAEPVAQPANRWRRLRLTRGRIEALAALVALIMTALGLAVAIPAVLGYNALVRGNKSIIARLNRFGHDLHAYFVTGARVTADGSANVVPIKQA